MADPRELPSPPRPQFVCLAVLLVLSGAAGLVYETVWTRQLSCWFSGTAVTSCLVLSAFMGGMALGSVAAGRRAVRVASPLSAYAYLELALALFGTLSPELLSSTGASYVWLARRIPDSPVALFTLKFGMFLGVLLVPAALMGATLPFAVRWAVRDPGRAGSSTGVLYGVNSLGGVIGCLVAGFWMIEALGLAAAATTGALANFAAALGALALRWVATEPEARVGVPGEDGSAPDRADGLGPILVVSGFTALAYEVLWARVLPLVLGSSVHSFSLMLATFVGGVSIGSFSYTAVLDRLGSPRRVLGAAQLLAGLWVLASLPFYGLLPYPFVFLRTVFGLSFEVYQLGAIGVSCLVMLVPAVCFGASFPAAVQATATVGAAIARRVGSLYGANTLGNIAGAMACGLVLIPGVGSPLAFQLCALLNLATGALLLWQTRALGRPALWLGGLALGTLVATMPAATRAWFPPLTVGACSRIRTTSWQEALLKMAGESQKEVVFVKEDTSSIASVYRFGGHLTLCVNGKADAGDWGDMLTQQALAHLPLVIHPAPRRVFVLGLGSGVTAGTALTYPVREVVCAEVSRSVVLAAGLFGNANHAPWNDRRFRLVVDDARHHLLLNPGRFDVITMEPSNPWVAGISNLYTADFLRLCRDRLEPDGIVQQWIHLYEIDAASVRLVLRTFRSVFPHVRTFQFAQDLLLLGATRREMLDAGAVPSIVSRMSSGPIADGFRRMGVSTPFTLFSAEQLSGRDVDDFAGLGPVLTDEFPVLEFRAPRAYYVGATAVLPSDHRPSRASLLDRYLAGRRPTAAELADLGRHWLSFNRRDGLADLLTGPGTPDDPELSFLAAKALVGLKESHAALPLARRAFRAAPTDLDRARTYFDAATQVETGNEPLVEPRRMPCSREAAEALCGLAPRVPVHWVDRAAICVATADRPAAEESLRKAAATGPVGPAVARRMGDLWARLARSWRRAGDLGRAVKAAKEAVALDPQNVSARELLREI